MATPRHTLPIVLAALVLLGLCSATLIINPAPGALTVPNAYVGYTATAVIAVTNPSNNSFAITSTAFATPGAPWSSQVSSTSVSANSTSTISVMFFGNQTGPATNNFTFTTNDPDAATATYILSADVILAPFLMANPNYTTLYFGDGSPSSHTPSVITFANIGNSTLQFSASIVGQNPMNFAVNPSTFSIAYGGAAVPVTVTCSATEYGELLAVLNFQTNDPRWPIYTYTLSCWSVHMGKDVAIGFVILFVFWLIFAILLWALFAFKQ